jgi:CheY-like chemotaxis protein
MPKRILVVEDDPLVRVVAVEALIEEGFDVVEAVNGEQALQHCSEHLADLLFTDIRLPGDVDGWEIAERCRDQNPGIPVIYASGYSDVEARPVAGSVFFRKPYRPADVVAAIRDLTTHH